MTLATRFLASATVGSLMVVGSSALVLAQAERAAMPPVAYPASFVPGSLQGVVRDERGVPIDSVVVSALGSSTMVAVTDKNGHFEFSTLTPGPYLIRAHLAGYVAARPQTVEVRPRGHASSAIALRRLGSETPILAAGFGGGAGSDEPESVAAPNASDDEAGSEATPEDPSETAWLLRHARRSVLKEVAVPVEFLVDGHGDRFVPMDLLSRAVESPARAATSFFVDTAFTGQVNLLTAGSFDTPQQFFSTDTLSRNVAYVSVSAPAGDADWTVRGALTQADISSWIVAGSYTTRSAAERHRYDVGLSYSTQRYDGGNLLALRDVTDGSRNSGTVYAYDSFAISPAVTLAYGGATSQYDYLHSRDLLSPRAELTVTPTEGLRVSAAVSRRALAPGAEEFLPPGDAGIWLPPQRTFSSLSAGRPFEAERTTHVDVALERDFGVSTLMVSAYRQHVDDQLVTLFGTEAPGQPASALGHYVVGNVGDADAEGYSAGFRTVIARRVHGSVEYTLANAEIVPEESLHYLLFLAPSAVRSGPERIHNLSTKIETEVPETATRVLVFYRVGTGFARPGGSGDGGSGALDARFDVQVRQSLPFMNFSNAQWEMVLAVRNFFRETGPEQSVYDELLVVRPPKRVVGGVTLRF